jgi:hypothetical protein
MTKERMKELMDPIDRQIMMCDDREDLIMIASAMMVYAKDIFDHEIGITGRKRMFKDFAEK